LNPAMKPTAAVPRITRPGRRKNGRNTAWFAAVLELLWSMAMAEGELSPDVTRGVVG